MNLRFWRGLLWKRVHSIAHRVANYAATRAKRDLVASVRSPDLFDQDTWCK